MNGIAGTPNKALWSATLGFFVGFAAVALFGPSAKLFQQVMTLGPLALGFLVAIPGQDLLRQEERDDVAHQHRHDSVMERHQGPEVALVF